MRLKSMNKTSQSVARAEAAAKNAANYTSLNQENANGEDNSFDLDMDSGEDEIDVGTHADSLLVSYNNNNTSYSSSSSAVAGVQNDHQFGAANPGEQSNFAVPQSSMSEADRKRAHHNALERKRRDHIKDSFHTLRDAIPNIKGEKVSTSRAQILKAATDYIKTMKTRNTVYQNDIDSIKKQNLEIEIQIKQLEKAKSCGASSSSGNLVIKSEASLQHNEQFNAEDNELKFELSDNAKSINNANNILKTNNVLILTKPSTSGAAGGPTGSKKFKTIYNTKNNLLNNASFM